MKTPYIPRGVDGRGPGRLKIILISLAEELIPMKHPAQTLSLGEHIEVEIQPSIRPNYSTLYVRVNGVTVVRIGHIESKNITFTPSES